MVDALIIDACRTPRGIGKPGKGALAGIHPRRLGATVLRALAGSHEIDRLPLIVVRKRPTLTSFHLTGSLSLLHA